MLTHGAVASRYLGEAVVYEAFADWTKARVRPELKTALGMLWKLTLCPLDFGPADIAPVLRIGVSPSGVEQAVIVGGYIFGYQNRMADALGADVPDDKVQRAGKMLNMTGRSMLNDRHASGEEIAYAGAIPAEIATMVERVIDGPGNADLDLRKAVFRRGMAYLGFAETDIAVPDSLVSYVDKIAVDAAGIGDEDVEQLLAAGWSEAEVFEVTVASSVAAGYGRLKIAWAALAEALDPQTKA